MDGTPQNQQSGRGTPRRFIPLLLVLAVAAAYANSLRGAFVFDDLYAIVHNPTIRSGNLSQILFLPAGEGGTVAGRPLVNLTLALNYAVSGTTPWSYHLFNILVHAAGACAVFGLGCLALRRVRADWLRQQDVALLAGIIAAVWALHPLQTEAVTYVIQRAESLASLSILLTLYCAARAAESPNPARWRVAAWLSCLAGIGCKETVVVTPLLVVLYDRAFLAASWRDVWTARWKSHFALACTWLPLAALVASSEGRTGSAGFDTPVTAFAYALTQCRAIPHYLALAFWPFPLVFDYGTDVVRDVPTALPGAVLVLVLLAIAGWAVARRPQFGFIAASFFLLLAPSSSVVPIATQTMAEHRMYLPLAAVVAAGVVALYRIWGPRIWLPVLAACLAAAVLTSARNEAYRSELSIWSDTVAACPGNARAHTNLGIALEQTGRVEEAVAHYEKALRIDSANAAAEMNLSDALLRLGRIAEAVAHGEAAVRLNDRSPDARVNLASALLRHGRPAEAASHFEAALQLQPGALDAELGLARSLADSGRPAEAGEHYQAVLRSAPENVDAWSGLAITLAQLKRPDEARRAAEAALKLDPHAVAALFLLGNLEIAAGNLPNAIQAYRRLLDAAPDHVPARNNLANALIMVRDVPGAIEQYREILRLRPDDMAVRENLQRALEYQRAAASRR